MRVSKAQTQETEREGERERVHIEIETHTYKRYYTHLGSNMPSAWSFVFFHKTKSLAPSFSLYACMCVCVCV